MDNICLEEIEFIKYNLLKVSITANNYGNFDIC